MTAPNGIQLAIALIFGRRAPQIDEHDLWSTVTRKAELVMRQVYKEERDVSEFVDFGGEA